MGCVIPGQESLGCTRTVTELEPRTKSEKTVLPRPLLLLLALGSCVEFLLRLSSEREDDANSAQPSPRLLSVMSFITATEAETRTSLSIDC